MNTKIMYIFTQTPLHIGSGSEIGIIDSPVQRERHTGFPINAGSSNKGVVRAYYNTPESGDDIFGKGNSAGSLSFSEAKLLLFPLRSVKGCYALATCPLALKRYAQASGASFEIPELKEGECYSASNLKIKNKVVLEEYAFTSNGEVSGDIVKALSNAFSKNPILKDLAKNIVLLSDEDFSYFAKNACQIQQHIKIKPENGVVDGTALFNIEVVPSESLFFSQITEVKDLKDNKVYSDFAEEKLLQFGSNATTGLGFSSVIIK